MSELLDRFSGWLSCLFGRHDWAWLSRPPYGHDFACRRCLRRFWFDR